MALLTFTGPQPLRASQWMNLLGQDAKECGYPGVQPGAVCEAASDLLGEEADGIAPLGPDILAAAFSVSVLKKTPTTVPDLLKKILDLTGIDAWSRLLRAAIDLYNIEELTIIGEWLLDQIHNRPTQELYAVENLVENVSVAHRRLRAKLYETLLEKVSKEESALPEQARILNNLGNSYSALGRRDDALEAAQRAVKIYERLAKQNPDAFEPDLAMSFGANGAVLKAAGNNLEAADSFLSGINSLSQLFLRTPSPFSQLMLSLVKDYVETCKSSGIEPETKTLAPIIEKLNAGNK